MNEPHKALSIVAAALRLAIAAVYNDEAQKEAGAEHIDQRAARAGVLGTACEVAEQLWKAGYYPSQELALLEMGIPEQMVKKYLKFLAEEQENVDN